jgi:hypothetical protein
MLFELLDFKDKLTAYFFSSDRGEFGQKTLGKQNLDLKKQRTKSVVCRHIKIVP